MSDYQSYEMVTLQWMQRYDLAGARWGCRLRGEAVTNKWLSSFSTLNTEGESICTIISVDITLAAMKTSTAIGFLLLSVAAGEFGFRNQHVMILIAPAYLTSYCPSLHSSRRYGCSFTD